MSDEFYIGWEAKAAPGISKATRRAVIALLAVAIMISICLAWEQRLIGAGVFEWGTTKTFSGIFRATPSPHLLVARPGTLGAAVSHSTYHLVAPWKFGLSQTAIADFDGKQVTLKGTLIYRGNQTMIETQPDLITASTLQTAPLPIAAVPLGRQTLVGEIVDSKCFLGVMNPGQLTPHRACAIRCISGGVPPLLLVRQKKGPPIYLLLVSHEGKPVNQKVLDLVAEPVEITGEVERQGDLLILRANWDTIRRRAHASKIPESGA